LRIRQRSAATFTHYSHQLACMALYFNALPTSLSQPQIDAYLVYVLERTKGRSMTIYKQTVFAIMYAYKQIALVAAPRLPRVVQQYELPVVLSQNECKRLLKSITNLKHKVVIALIYSAGLRVSEAVKLKLTDIDFDRATLMVRNGKGGKDRCLPLSKVLATGLHQYLQAYHPQVFLLNAHTKGKAYSTRSIQSVMAQAMAKADIQKNASVHSLRHSFATHLLEQGVNLVTLQALMGHTKIQTTLVYTQLLSHNTQSVKSPLDSLYGL
jgi:integrase/recombinase XerD